MKKMSALDELKNYTKELSRWHGSSLPSPAQIEKLIEFRKAAYGKEI